MRRVIATLGALAIVCALTADLAMQPAHALTGLLPILGTFLATGYDALSTGQALQRAFEVSRVLYEMAVGVAHQVTDAPIEGNDRLGFRSRRRDFELAQDRNEPLVPFTPQGAGLRGALNCGPSPVR